MGSYFADEIALAPIRIPPLLRSCPYFVVRYRADVASSFFMLFSDTFRDFNLVVERMFPNEVYTIHVGSKRSMNMPM